MNLKENLKRIRKDNNLSQEQLAEKLGVSRQSVSKWESGQAYPEMDKVLQLCQLFNLNIDDLLNQNIKEVNNNKQAKINLNKYIDDFFDYITKTVDMFSSMSFKEKIKCVFEQLIILIIIISVFMIIGAIGSNIVLNILSFLSYNISNAIYHIIASIYLIIILILTIVLMLHIFKVRYLDYYIIVKDDDNDKQDKITNNKNKESEESENKIYLEKKREKIIIRDPNHSSYKFISLLVKCILFIIKVMVLFAAIGLCFMLIFLVISCIVSFLFIKTGTLFIGGFLTLIGCIAINLILLVIMYNFIIGKKNKLNKLALFFIGALFLIGIGCGIVAVGLTNFEYIDDINSKYYIQEEKIIKMKKDLFINDNYFDIEYIEDDSNNIKVVYKHSKYYNLIINTYENNGISFHVYQNDSNDIKQFKNYIDDINNKKLINYSRCKIYIYTSKENIEALKNNKQNYFNKIEKEEINNYENRISQLEDQLEEKDNKIYELEEQLENRYD